MVAAPKVKPKLRIGDEVTHPPVNAIFTIADLSKNGKLAKIVCKPQNRIDVVPVGELIYLPGTVVGQQFKPN